MARSLLIRGMLVGLLAGLLMFGFGKVFGEPQVDRAVAFEAVADAAKAHSHGAHGPSVATEDSEPVSRPTQAGLGLFTGVMVYGAAFGGLFALVFAYAYGRIGPAGPRAVAALLAGAGFVAVSLVPMIKYPANPPAVGEAGTIAMRTAMYFLMLMISIGAMATAIVLRTRLLRRMDAWNATLAAVGAYCAFAILAWTGLPGIDEVPADFPASVLWNFRVASLGLQVVMWVTLGLVFGWVAQRALAPRHGASVGSRMQTLVR